MHYKKPKPCARLNSYEINSNDTRCSEIVSKMQVQGVKLYSYYVADAVLKTKTLSPLTTNLGAEKIHSADKLNHTGGDLLVIC